MFSPDLLRTSALTKNPEALKFTNSFLFTGKKDLPKPSKNNASMTEVFPLPLSPKIKFFLSPKLIEKLFKFRKPLISNFLTSK